MYDITDNKATLAARVAFVRRGLSTRRYHQYHTHGIDSVGKHSAGVAMFCAIIDPQCSRDVLFSCLTHDLAEAVVGDLPAPTKRALSPRARAEFDDLEESKLIEHKMVVGLSKSEGLLVKLGDYLDGLSFCIEERRRGNTELNEVAETYVSYLAQLYNTLFTMDTPPGWLERALDVIHIVQEAWSDINGSK